MGGRKDAVMDYEKLLADSPVFVTWLADQGLNLVVALAIIVIGWMLARWAQKAVRRTLEGSPRTDMTLVPIIATLVRYAILVATLIAVLDRFGVQTASLLAVIGAAGLALGLALQGTLSNVAAGFMLLLLRPFRAGDAIEVAGHAGTVREVGLFATVLVSYDGIWRQLPNGTIWSNPIINYSREPRRLVDITLSIAYESDVEKAMAIASEAMAEDERVLRDPGPSVVVGELSPTGVNLIIRGWTRSGDFWGAKTSLQQILKSRLGDAGIRIPTVTPAMPSA